MCFKRPENLCVVIVYLVAIVASEKMFTYGNRLRSTHCREIMATLMFKDEEQLNKWIDAISYTKKRGD